MVFVGGGRVAVFTGFKPTGLKKIADLKLDDDEILSVVKIDIKKVLRMIKKGEIQDSKTICAVPCWSLLSKASTSTACANERPGWRTAL